jgi:hypothetical protein
LAICAGGSESLDIFDDKSKLIIEGISWFLGTVKGPEMYVGQALRDAAVLRLSIR